MFLPHFDKSTSRAPPIRVIPFPGGLTCPPRRTRIASMPQHPPQRARNASRKPRKRRRDTRFPSFLLFAYYIRPICGFSAAIPSRFPAQNPASPRRASDPPLHGIRFPGAVQPTCPTMYAHAKEFLCTAQIGDSGCARRAIAICHCFVNKLFVFGCNFQKSTAAEPFESSAA